MKKLTILLFLILISFNSYGDVGDKYFCEAKESKLDYKKEKMILTWNQNSMTQKSITTQDIVDIHRTSLFITNKDSYFVAASPYEGGDLVSTFDGKTFATLFVRSSYTFPNEYICTKL